MEETSGTTTYQDLAHPSSLLYDAYLHDAGTKPHFLLLFFKIFQAVYKFNPKRCAVKGRAAPPLLTFLGTKPTACALTCQSQEPWRRKELVLKISRMMWSRRNTSRRAQRAPAKTATASRECMWWSSTASLSSRKQKSKPTKIHAALEKDALGCPGPHPGTACDSPSMNRATESESRSNPGGSLSGECETTSTTPERRKKRYMVV